MVGNMAGPREEKIARLIDFVRPDIGSRIFEILDVTAAVVRCDVEHHHRRHRKWPAHLRLGMQRDVTARRSNSRLCSDASRRSTGARSNWPAKSPCRSSLRECPAQHCRRRVHHRHAAPDHVVESRAEPSPAWRRPVIGRNCGEVLHATFAKADGCGDTAGCPRIAPAPPAPLAAARVTHSYQADASWSRRFGGAASRRRVAHRRCACFAT